MFTIDLMLKYSPIPIAIQRKLEADAQATYQQILEAMRSVSPQLLELHCEKEPHKKVAIFSDQISAVIISEKAGSTATGRGAGFFAAIEAE